jgi:hypothetical protein
MYSFTVDAFKNVMMDAERPYFEKSSSLSFGGIYLPKFLFSMSKDSFIHFSPNFVWNIWALFSYSSSKAVSTNLVQIQRITDRIS